MKKKMMKKLLLAKETVRRLEAQDGLEHVGGGLVLEDPNAKKTKTCTVDTGCTHC